MDDTVELEENKKRDSKVYLGVAVAAFLGAVILIFSWNNSFYSDMYSYYASVPPSAGVSKPAAKGRIGVDFGNGERRAFEGRLYTGMTILAALREAEQVGNFKTQTDERGKIVGIAGVKNNGRKNWRMYVNSIPVSEFPGRMDIKSGDNVIFRYE